MIANHFKAKSAEKGFDADDEIAGVGRPENFTEAISAEADVHHKNDEVLM